MGAIAIFATLMSVGLLIKGKALTGTCASQNAALLGGDGTCGVCGQAVGSCENETSNKKTEPEEQLS